MHEQPIDKSSSSSCGNSDEKQSSSDQPQSIKLPGDHEAVFRNLSKAKRFAIDIGGSLTKIAYYSTVPIRRARYASFSSGDEGSKSDDEQNLSSYEMSTKRRLHFVKFETKYIESCLNFIQSNLVSTPSADNSSSNDATEVGKTIKATGGGAFKYTALITAKLGLKVDREDELLCLIKGCNFLLKNIPNEVFIFQRNQDPEYKFQNAEPNVFPYLLVNVGSGVSIMKVESEEKYERIGGSSLGGGTFWGLGSLLTKARNFDELLQLANEGDHRNVDMLVKDIYGGDFKALGLHGELIASSFGKTVHPASTAEEGSQMPFTEADIARSLLYTVSNDIGQISCLYAMAHGLTKVYFGGYFLRGHPLSMHAVSYAINFWSQGKVQALFLRHEGYLGAIGAFLRGAEEYDDEKYSWNENYAGSSGLQNSLSADMLMTSNNAFTPARVDQLEMDRFEARLVFCPLLSDAIGYIADTVDLTLDHDAREYWLRCFEDAIDNFVDVAVKSQSSINDAIARGSQFKRKYVRRLHHLKEHPFAYGSLTVRSLLDMREHCLNEFDFPDPYLQQKQCENEAALILLPALLQSLDAMEFVERQCALVCGILAGNVFDWGAKEVVELMKSEGNFGFAEAKNKLQVRPWLIDNLDSWVKRMSSSPPYHCAAIFVDNSGIDVLLGVIPFARELIKQGTEVILCANAKPALNDVTHGELLVLLKEVGSMCPFISKAVDENKLVAADSGQASPCLDLSRLNGSLADTMKSRNVDLVILEGMGRAVHTNLNARFECDALKLAVIKNRWLANRLGGDMFAVMCKFQPAENISAESTIS